MEGVGWTEGVQERREGEEGEKRRKQAKREWRIGETRREGKGRTKQTELIYRDVADPPRPLGPPRAPCSFSFLSFCYVEPAAFPAIRSIRPLSLLFPRSSCRRSRGDASSMRPTPATRCRLILFLSFSPCTGEKTKPRDPVAGVSFSISSNIFPRLLALI